MSQDFFHQGVVASAARFQAIGAVVVREMQFNPELQNSSGFEIGRELGFCQISP
jgi:hypothetical protein